MKTPSTDLFDLIKSLTAQEKKYFKQYSQQYSEGRESTYLLLFDAIDKQKAYDEEAIKQKFKEHDFVKQLSVAKTYLYERILDTLADMSSDSDETLYLEKLNNRCHVLMRKGLMNAALNMYDKVEKKALEINRLSLLPHITRQKNQIISKTGKSFNTDDLIANAEASFRHAQILANQLEYEVLSVKANVLFGDPAVNTAPAVMQKLDELMQHPLLQKDGQALSMLAWYFYARTKYRYLLLKGYMDEGFELLKNSIVQMKQFPVTRDWQVSNYRLYCDFIHICFHMRKYDECRRLMDEVQVFIDKKYQPQRTMLQDHFYNVMRFSAHTAEDVDATLKVWEEKQDWWQEEKNSMEPSIFLLTAFCIMKLYFYKQDWRNAITLFNQVNNNQFLWNTHLGARLYWLMIQYEIDNLELLRNQVQSTSEWFKKNNFVTDLDRIVFSNFKRLPNAAGKDERKAMLQDFMKEVKAHKPTDEADVYYDLLMWLESKIENIGFADVVRRNAGAVMVAQ